MTIENGQYLLLSGLFLNVFLPSEPLGLVLNAFMPSPTQQVQPTNGCLNQVHRGVNDTILLEIVNIDGAPQRSTRLALLGKVNSAMAFTPWHDGHVRPGGPVHIMLPILNVRLPS